MGNQLLAFGVVGGLCAVLFWVAVAYLLRHAAVRLSAACGRGWDEAVEFGGKVAEAFESRNWSPVAVRA